MANADGVQAGGPHRAADIIVPMVRAGALPLRLPLGAEAVQRLTATANRDLDEL